MVLVPGSKFSWIHDVDNRVLVEHKGDAQALIFSSVQQKKKEQPYVLCNFVSEVLHS